MCFGGFFFPIIRKFTFFVICFLFGRKITISVLSTFSEILFAQNQCIVSFKSCFTYVFICFRELLYFIDDVRHHKIELCGTPWVLIKAVDWVRFNEFVGGVSDTPVVKFRQECHYLLYQMLFEKENSNHTVARVKCMSKVSQLRLLEHD